MLMGRGYDGADQILFLEAGTVAESGVLPELLAAQGKFASGSTLAPAA